MSPLLSVRPLNSLSGDTLYWKHPFVSGSIPAPTSMQMTSKSDFSPSAFPKKLDGGGDFPATPRPSPNPRRLHSPLAQPHRGLLHHAVIRFTNERIRYRSRLVCPVVAVLPNRGVPPCTAASEKRDLYILDCSHKS